MGLITIGLKRFFDRPLIASIFVAILAFAVYANSLRNGFVMDDRSIFVDNPLITGDIESIFKSIDTTDPQHRLPYYRPFTYLTYYIEYRLHGLEPFWVRFSNISLHALNAFLVFWVARILIGNTYAAFFTAVLFAVHPINSEAVNFNSGGRNTMLACFFVLSSFLFFKKTTLQNSYVYSLVGGVLFLLGLFSKEFAICLLPILMVDEIFSILKHKDVSFKLRLLRLLPYLTALVVYLYMRWKTLSLMGIQTGIIPGLGTEILEQWYRFPDLETRILNNLYIIPRYLFNIIWPFYLSPKYYLPEDVFIHLHLIFLGLICLSIIIWFLFKNRNTVIAFGLIWTVFFWLPVSGLFIFSSEQMADRYLYAPLIGVWLIVGDLLTRKGNTLNRKILLGTVLLFFSIVTIWTNEDWESDITVFSRVIKKSPDNPMGYIGLGSAYYELGLNDPAYIGKSEVLFKKAMEIVRYDEMFISNKRPSMVIQLLSTKMGNIKYIQGDFDSAREFYSRALQIFPYDLEARINRAMAYEQLGRTEEALMDYKVFLSTPGNYVKEAKTFAFERIIALSGDRKGLESNIGDH